MTPTIKSFTQTSNKPYDRHFYQVKLPNHNELAFEDYEQLRAWWFQTHHKNGIVHVYDYPDIPNTTTDTELSSPKGFG